MAQLVAIGSQFVVAASFPPRNESATPAMTEDTRLPYHPPAAQRKTAAARSPSAATAICLREDRTVGKRGAARVDAMVLTAALDPVVARDALLV